MCGVLTAGGGGGLYCREWSRHVHVLALIVNTKDISLQALAISLVTLRALNGESIYVDSLDNNNSAILLLMESCPGWTDNWGLMSNFC